MKLIILSIIFFLPLIVFAEEDVRSNVADPEKGVVTNSVIDIGKHIFGHEYGVTENDFIAKEGKPDGYFSLSGGKSVMIYGNNVGIVFRNKKLIGVRISSTLFDWELAKDLKSKSRFDGISWRVKQGVEKGMTKKQILEIHGKDLRGADYQKFLQFEQDRLVISFSSSQIDGGERKFIVCGIYLSRE